MDLMGPVGDGGGSVVISTLALKSLWKPLSFILYRWDLGRVYWILVLVPSYHEFPRNASVSEILNIYFCSSENLSQDLVSWPQLRAFLLACDLLYLFSLAPCRRACVHAQSLQLCLTLCNRLKVQSYLFCSLVSKIVTESQLRFWQNVHSFICN